MRSEKAERKREEEQHPAREEHGVPWDRLSGRQVMSADSESGTSHREHHGPGSRHRRSGPEFSGGAVDRGAAVTMAAPS
ncbi:hypothetical protein ACN24M_02465 [Streptomyces microflavus]